MLSQFNSFNLFPPHRIYPPLTRSSVISLILRFALFRPVSLPSNSWLSVHVQPSSLPPTAICRQVSEPVQWS